MLIALPIDLRVKHEIHTVTAIMKYDLEGIPLVLALL